MCRTMPGGGSTWGSLQSRARSHLLLKLFRNLFLFLLTVLQGQPTHTPSQHWGNHGPVDGVGWLLPASQLTADPVASY